ncbi:hypothetical protein C2G38_2123710 [Gigaspora rosea]|uniref:Uncharacterized protein n=1 Tax=Gigaspora rosea TaxID=44941 RepID=A0A397U744_9GLOM|nr:hypothetical protein C2G38_2123710 [Gigaspora rosea]
MHFLFILISVHNLIPAPNSNDLYIYSSYLPRQHYHLSLSSFNIFNIMDIPNKLVHSIFELF